MVLKYSEFVLWFLCDVLFEGFCIMSVICILYVYCIIFFRRGVYGSFVVDVYVILYVCDVIS